MLAGATLFTKNQFDKLLPFAEVLKPSFISDTTYYKIRETYLFPVINELYNQQQVAHITAFADEHRYKNTGSYMAMDSVIVLGIVLNI